MCLFWCERLFPFSKCQTRTLSNVENVNCHSADSSCQRRRSKYTRFDDSSELCSIRTLAIVYSVCFAYELAKRFGAIVFIAKRKKIRHFEFRRMESRWVRNCVQILMERAVGFEKNPKGDRTISICSMCTQVNQSGMVQHQKMIQNSLATQQWSHHQSRKSPRHQCRRSNRKREKFRPNHEMVSACVLSIYRYAQCRMPMHCVWPSVGGRMKEIDCAIAKTTCW